MSARAWIFQDSKQVTKVGEANASYYVGWLDPQQKRKCKSCGAGKAGKRAAKKLKADIEAELRTGNYEDRTKRKWSEFRERYESHVASSRSPRTVNSVKTSLGHFERLCAPNLVGRIDAKMIDEFAEKRRLEPGKKKKSSLSPASLNCDLRNLKAALRKAHRWGYLPTVPQFDFEREAKTPPRFVTPEHFAAIYSACSTAKFPRDLPNVSQADWWRSLLVVGYMTGWRISEILSFRREDFDAKNGTAVLRAENTKNGNEELVPLHPIVVQHLQQVTTFDEFLFPWNHDRRTLDIEFHRIQRNATIKDENGEELPLKLHCRGKHDHTEACHVYGFHDLRRAFATQNASRLSADALQSLMRHQSYQTTQRYISMAGQLSAAVESLHVPELKANAAN